MLMTLLNSNWAAVAATEHWTVALDGGPHFRQATWSSRPWPVAPPPGRVPRARRRIDQARFAPEHFGIFGQSQVEGS